MKKKNLIAAAKDIWYYEHEVRLYDGAYDRFYTLLYSWEDMVIDKPLGWLSAGVTLDVAKRELTKLQKQIFLGFFHYNQVEYIIKANAENIEIDKSLSTIQNQCDSGLSLDIVIIGVGEVGCAAINTNPVQELASDREESNIHYVAISNDAEVLNRCIAGKRIFVPEIIEFSFSQLHDHFNDIRNPDIVYIITGCDDISRMVLSPFIAKYFKFRAQITFSMPVIPFVSMKYASEKFKSLIKYSNGVIMIAHEHAFKHIVNFLQFTIDNVCIEHMIHINLDDLCMMFSPARYEGSIQKLSVGIEGYLGYAAPSKDNYPYMAKSAVEQSLRKMNLPPNKCLLDAYAILYTIKANMNTTGDEVNEVGEIIRNLMSPHAKILFSILFVDEDVAIDLDLQIVALFEVV